MNDEKNNLSNYAMELANSGYIVLPVSKNDKKPIIKWKNLADQKPTAEEVKKWFNSDVNLAILCGTASSNLIALDFDKVTDFQKWQEEFQQIIPSGYIEKTGRGYHAIFKLSESVTDEILKAYHQKYNVEPLWAGHCVVVAPSIHASGKAYEAIAGDLTSLKPIDPKSLGLQPIKQNSKTETAKTETAQAQKIYQGERNNFLFIQAVKLAKAGISEEAILAALQSENTAKCIPPLDHEEIQTIVKSAGNYKSPEKEQEKKRINVLTMDEIFTTPEVSWAIEDILYDESLTLLAGFAGKGKSILSLEIAKAVASGQFFLGRFKVNRTGKVLIIDEENSPADIHSRFLDMKINPKLPICYCSFQSIKLDDDNCFAALQETIEREKPVLVIVDSLVRIHRGRENESDSMAPVMERLRAIVNMGTNVLVIHHHRKGAGAVEERVRGSSDIVASVDAELALIQKGNHLELSSGKTRRETIEPLKMRIEVRNGRLGFYLIEEPQNKRTKALQLIKTMLQEPKTLAEIQEKLNEEQLNYSDKTLREMLAQMKDEIVENHTLRNKSVYQLRESRLEGLRLKQMQKMKEGNH